MTSRFELRLLVLTLTDWGRQEPCAARRLLFYELLELVSVTTRRKMHTHRRAVDEHVACPCSGVMSDNDEAPLSPHAPCALCTNDEAIGCVPVPGRSALLCAACADAIDRWTTPTKSIAAGFQRSSLRPFGMRVLTPLEEQTIAMSRAHMLVLKLSCANAGSGQQPVLRKHVFPHPRKPCLQQSCAKQLRLSE